MRTFGVEEELLLIEAATLSPLPEAERLLARHHPDAHRGHEITLEFKQEQIEVVSPPQASYSGQLRMIRAGRSLADAAAAEVGGRVVALPTAPEVGISRPVDSERFRKISREFGMTSAEQLTCALHTHVLVYSREEGVAVLNRIREWLPVLLALSANSPFWQGADTGFASYRYQAWNRWPMTGPNDYFASVSAHDRHQTALLGTSVPLDAGMFYFDARLCEHQPTLEVRITDVCLEATHAAAIAAIVRALVETLAQQWREGVPALRTPTSVLRSWSWQASRHGVAGELINPFTGTPRPAADIIELLLEQIRPVLIDYGELEAVSQVVRDILGGGSGAVRQRRAFATRHELRDVVAYAIGVTHH